MEYRPLKKDSIIIQAKQFKPHMPELVSIQFADETVTVQDLYGQHHILPFDQVDICEIIDPASTLPNP